MMSVLECLELLEKVYFSLQNGIICPKPSSSSSLVLYFKPADTKYQNDASSQTLVN